VRALEDLCRPVEAVAAIAPFAERPGRGSAEGTAEDAVEGAAEGAAEERVDARNNADAGAANTNAGALPHDTGGEADCGGCAWRAEHIAEGGPAQATTTQFILVPPRKWSGGSSGGSLRPSQQPSESLSSAQPQPQSSSPPASSSSYDGAQHLLAHAARDWSAAGRASRQDLYGPVLAAAAALHAPLTMLAAAAEAAAAGAAEKVAKFAAAAEGRGVVSPRALVPGCGAGRLAWELAAKGFSVHANDGTRRPLLGPHLYNAAAVHLCLASKPISVCLSCVALVRRSELRDAGPLRGHVHATAALGRWRCLRVQRRRAHDARNNIVVPVSSRGRHKPGGCSGTELGVQ